MDNERINVRMRHTIAVAFAASCIVLVALTGCGNKDNLKTAFEAASNRPDTYPVMLNADMPFKYPPPLYAEKVQGNVTLRLYVDSTGTVIDDSTRIVESSKVPMLDSAALKGSRDLKFVPAKLRGVPMPVTILFPVYFRHPEAPPPPGDSLLKKVTMPGADSAAKQAAQTNQAKQRKK